MDSRKENLKLFCQKAELYGVCDEISGDDNHTRVHLGKEGDLKARFWCHLRKDYMRVYYNSGDEININVVDGSELNTPDTGHGYDYFSEIRPGDYDEFLQFVALKLRRIAKHSKSDINTPIEPQKIIREDEGLIIYQCPRCDVLFKQSTRCPECGQLIKE